MNLDKFPDTDGLRYCPAHSPEPQYLPIEEFGISRGRPDGRNRYCRDCARRQVYEARHRKAAIPERKPNALASKVVWSTSYALPEELDGVARMVARALLSGPKTQRRIAAEIRRFEALTLVESTGLSDVVADGLASLKYDFDLVDFDKSSPPDERVYSLRRESAAHYSERKRA